MSKWLFCLWLKKMRIWLIFEFDGLLVSWSCKGFTFSRRSKKSRLDPAMPSPDSRIARDFLQHANGKAAAWAVLREKLQ